MYDDSTLYGPYKAKDQRLRIVLVNKLTKEKLTMSYQKYIMETYLGRKLEQFETVDHIDKDPLNNAISNLRVLRRSEHSKIDVIRVRPVDFICPVCGKPFKLEGRRLHDLYYSKIKRNSFGPFCSKICLNTWRKSPRSYDNNCTGFVKEFYSLKEGLAE